MSVLETKKIDVSNPTGSCSFDAFVLAPKGLESPRLLRAAERAGGLGFLQCATATIEAEVQAALEAGVTRIGVFAGTLEDMKAISLLKDPALSTVMAPAEVILGATTHAKKLRRQGVKLLCVAIRCDDRSLSLSDRIDGYVLKGHECAGLVSEQTAFVLLQAFGRHTDLPLFVQGGITPATAAAARVGGAAGVVLGDEIMLLSETDLSGTNIRNRIASLSGSETLQVEHPTGDFYLRGLGGPGPRQADEISAKLENIQSDGAGKNGDGTDACLQAMIEISDGFSWAEDSSIKPGIKPGGQGLTLAGPLARKYATLGRLLKAISEAAADLPTAAAKRRALAEGGPLAELFGTRYPVIQGPMTRVSDVSDFSKHVGAGGALPMSALSLLKGPEVDQLLADTRSQMNGMPWGVGMLGFAPNEILKPQFEAVDRIRPDFAIIAGGRIDQVSKFEGMGIRTFVHASTASLITGNLDDGMRRFIIEGRECGGHIGPLTSFVLWGSIVESLLDHPIINKQGSKVQIVFAGGIHDAVSAAMVATIGEPLAQKGVSIGVLMGTGYLFTKEIVDSGAIIPDYQKVAVECDSTQSLWEGPGYANRCAITPIAAEIRQRRSDMKASGASVTEVRKAIEAVSMGRLRMASKGIARQGEDRQMAEIGEDQRRQEGMYMIGQIAAFRDETLTISDLHQDVSAGSVAYLQNFANRLPAVAAAPAPPPADIAIVGMGTLLPGSDTLAAYWRRILSGESAIREVPADRWDKDAYFDEDRTARDRIYSRWGGFLDNVEFDPLAYGIPPATLSSVDPMQLLSLELVSDVMRDVAQGAEDIGDRSRVSVMLGFSGGGGELGGEYIARTELLRLLGGDVPEELLARLPEWSEDSFSGTLPNVSAGRVANRFDFGGTNITVDAACASSLAAIYQGVMELESGRSDMVVAGGIDTQQSPYGYMCFAKTGALSPRGVCNTFDAESDGIVISEGLAAIALKRLSDAEAAGDRIYAVIKGVGASSDGRAKGLTAPLPKGQKRALRRAYRQAGYSPATVDLFEAHGTGTVAGDRAELETVSEVLFQTGATESSAAIGSVKTLIGHTKAAAGAAGLIKVAMGLHHKVLPPHALVKTPNQGFAREGMPLFISQQPRPWATRPNEKRRGGVSSFGFGGTNFHITLEEYSDPLAPVPQVELGRSVVPVALSANSRDDLGKRLETLIAALTAGKLSTPKALAELARSGAVPEATVRAGFIAETLADALEKLEGLLAHLTKDTALPRGVHFSQAPELLSGGKLAFVFPGQGSQYPGMARESMLLDPVMLDLFDRAEVVLADTPSFENTSLSQALYPGDAFDRDQKKAQMAALSETQITQPALGTVEAALAALLGKLNVVPDMVAGHSYGEFVALHAAGVLTFEDLIRLSEARGRAMVSNGDPDRPGSMAAVGADRAATEAAIAGMDGVTAVNFNSHSQTVIAGSVDAVEAAITALVEAEFDVRRVPVTQAFHSPLMVAARDDFDKSLESVAWQKPNIPVFSNTHGGMHGKTLKAIRKTMSDHLVSPVDFVGMSQAMADKGATVFVEVGPKSVLSSRLSEILGPEAATCITLDRTGGDVTSFIDGLVALFVAGAPVDFAALTGGMAAPEPRTLPEPPRQLWYLNGGYVRRADQPLRDVKPIVLDSFGPLQKQPATLTAIPEKSAQAVASEQAISSPAAFEGRDNSISTARTLEFMEILPKHFEQLDRGAGRSEVFANFHQMMGDFLRVQENVMLAYLGQEGTASTHSQPVGTAFVAPQVSVPQAAAMNVQPVPAPAPAAPIPAAPAPVAPQAVAPAAPEVVAQPAPQPQVQAAPASEAAVDISEEGLIAAFITLVSEKTGYPEDALDPDQDLEADLGVDSIKRMEILGALRKVLPQNKADAMQAEMEMISELPTIRSIIEFVAAAGNDEPSKKQEALAGEARPFDLAGEADNHNSMVLPRFVQQAFSEPADHVERDLTPGARVVVTETADNSFHLAVLSALAEAGLEGVLLPRSLMENKDTSLLETWLAELRDDKAPDALIFLEGCENHTSPPVSFEKWHAVHQRISKGLYRVAQKMAADLKDGGRIIAATQMGGQFGRTLEADDPALRAGFSGGGTVGIVKVLSLEWPTCSSKAVDLDITEGLKSRATHLVSELLFLKGRREAGYPKGERTIFRTEPRSMVPSKSSRPVVDSDWVVVATGGARGITAECLRTLAPYGPRLVLLGRSAVPDPEAPELRDLDLVGLRKHYLAEAIASGSKPKPKDIESQVHRHLGHRDMTRNLADLAELGAKVEYHAVDVCDPAAVKNLFTQLYDNYGRIDLVVHGAGLIQDAFLEKKTPESFDQVFDTKVDAAFHLVNNIRPETLKGLCFFTSVAGRYGNRGQVDYAAANETLNRFAWDLKRRWKDVTVKAINWGPWGQTTTGAGMVTPDVRAQFLARGIGMVEAKPGADYFFKEMFWADDAEVEGVAWVADGETMEEDVCALPPRPGHKQIEVAAPLLSKAVKRENGKREVVWRFDAVNAPYVDHHRFDGHGVLPYAGMMQMMSEIPRIFGLDQPVIAIENMAMLQGITLENGAVDLHFELEPEGADGGRQVIVRTSSQPKRIAYRATLRLGELPPPPADQRLVSVETPWDGPDLHAVYAGWLSHGPRFQTLVSLDGCDNAGIQATLVPTKRTDFVPHAENSTWDFDPSLIDGLLQMVWIWSRRIQGASTLPLTFTRTSRYAVQDMNGPFTGQATVLSGTSDSDVTTDIRLFDSSGALVYHLEQFKGFSSPQLNRLSGGWQGGIPPENQRARA